MAEGFFIHIGYHQYLIGTIVLNHCRDQSVIHQLEIGKINRRLKNCHIDPILLQASFRFIDIFFFEVIRGYSQNLVKLHQLCKVISDQSIADQHLCLTAGHCLNKLLGHIHMLEDHHAKAHIIILIQLLCRMRISLHIDLNRKLILVKARQDLCKLLLHRKYRPAHNNAGCTGIKSLLGILKSVHMNPRHKRNVNVLLNLSQCV